MQNCVGSSKLCAKVQKTTGCADMCGKQLKVPICAMRETDKSAIPHLPHLNGASAENSLQRKEKSLKSKEDH